MKDTPDDQTTDRQTAPDDSRIREDVPADADWAVVAQVPYDPSKTGGLTTTIIYAVADAEGVPPSDVKQPPLYEVVDTAALEAALFGSETGVQAGQCTTEFMYRGYRIVVRTDGWIHVSERVGP